MKKLSALLFVSLTMFGACKKEPTPEEKAQAAMAQALKAMGAQGSASGSNAPDLAALTAMAGAMANAIGSAAAVDGTQAGSAAAAAGTMAAAAKDPAAMGALGALAGALGGGTLTHENQLIVTEVNGALAGVTPIFDANKEDCVALGKALAAHFAANTAAFKKVQDLKSASDDSQKMALGLAMLTGPGMTVGLKFAEAGMRCKDDKGFTDAMASIKSAMP